MPTLDVNHPGIPDLQFVLLVLALCTSELENLNLPESVRISLFDGCWAMLHSEPSPKKKEERILDLRAGDELALQAMVDLIRSALSELDIRKLTWDHPPSPASRTSTPEALPLLERLEQLYPPSDLPNRPSGQ
ncbi:MAG TPA: hypothetical protein VGJ57_02460 [Nitrospirales bacterium]|jgi:hypothetical protein